MNRFKILTVIVMLFFIAAILKIFQKQILEHNKYVDLAKGQQIIQKEVIPKRGKIYARDGADLFPLATNLTYYSISIIPKNVTDKEVAANKLASILSLDEKDLYGKINSDKLYLPPIAHKVDENKATEIKDLKITGIYLEEENVRLYTEGETTSHILGFVNNEGDGQYGIEGFYNGELKGEKGVISGEKDLKGRVVFPDNEKGSSNGADLVLTIDRTVQFEAFKKIKEAVEKYKGTSGSMVIMDPRTGAVIAMASYPTFDPSKFNEIKDYSIFQNPVIAKTWEPGSVFKPITMSIGIDQNKITKDTTENFGASIKIGGYEIWTFDKKSHGTQTMTQVLETSNNVGMVYVAQKIGKEQFYKYLRDYGFGSLLGIDLDKETTKNLKPLKSWKDVELATMGFGQGIAVTPLQLTSAVCTIANGGKLVWPHIVDEFIYSDGRRTKVQNKEIRQVISPATAETVTQMMVSVVDNGHGKKAKVSGFKVAGKTGTAQIPKQGGSGYEEGKSIGSFVGFAPAENPRFVMLVKIDEPQTVEWAESSAAPVFGEMATFLLNYFQVSPTE
ncbi:MAG: penicillin-binding protein 2 [Candidatus Berkelbacteria bacterium]|nr:penicillin-binding protein 2 [Candidatus Berkelbacteria bacterium]